MSTASGAPVNLLAAISVTTGVREPALPTQLGSEEVRKKPGCCPTSLFLNSHGMEESPIAPRFMQEYPGVVLGPGHLNK